MKLNLEHLEPDMSAEEAWLVMEITKETMRHRERMIELAIQYERRVQAGRVLDSGPTSEVDRGE